METTLYTFEVSDLGRRVDWQLPTFRTTLLPPSSVSHMVSHWGLVNKVYSSDTGDRLTNCIALTLVTG